MELSFANQKLEVEEFVEQWLGKKIVTIQTDSGGLPVNIISLEELTDIDKELYMSFVVDRGEKCVSMIVSEAGGMNIEEVAEKTQKRFSKAKLNSDYLIEEKEIKALANSLNFNSEQTDQFSKIVLGCAKLFKDKI